LPERRGRTAPVPARRASGTARRAPVRPTAIVNLQDPGHISFYKWWLYGASGIGKTVLLGTMPTPSLIVTTDVEGTASAKAFGSTVDELKVESWQRYVEFHEWYVHSGHKEYPWLSLDTVDELEELCWEAQLIDPTMRRASRYQPNKADYPVVWRKVKEHVKELLRTPANIVFSSHVMQIDTEDEEGEDTVTKAMPQVGSTKRGDLSSYLCAQMTLVGYYRPSHTDDSEEHRKLLTSAGSRWVAKDRHNAFGRGMLDPTIPKMLARIEQSAATAAAAAPPRRRARRAATR
jgi:hypothetical protein